MMFGRLGLYPLDKAISTMTATTNPTILASREYSPGQAPLPSWNEGSTKQSILDFVRGVTAAGGPHFVKPEERIAVFDNDGTLWCEQPFYVQLAFVLDRMKAMAPQHPEWKDNPLYSAVLNNDMKTVAAGGVKAILELATITHAGMTTDDFAKSICVPTASKRLSSPAGELNLCASGWTRSMGFRPNR
jgi:hypothetical protein